MAPCMWQPVVAALNIFRFLYFLYFLNSFYQCLRTVMCSLRFESIRKHWIMIIFIIGNFNWIFGGSVKCGKLWFSDLFKRTTFGTSVYCAVICTRNGYSCGSEKEKKGVQSRSETPIKEKMIQAIVTCYHNGKRSIDGEQDGGVNGTCKDAMGVS